MGWWWCHFELITLWLLAVVLGWWWRSMRCIIVRRRIADYLLLSIGWRCFKCRRLIIRDSGKLLLRCSCILKRLPVGGSFFGEFCSDIFYESVICANHFKWLAPTNEKSSLLSYHWHSVYVKNQRIFSGTFNAKEFYQK